MEFVKRNFRLIVIGVMMLWALFSVFSFQLINQPAAKLGAQNQPVNAPLESPRKPFCTVANFNIYSNIKLGLDLIGGSQFEFKALPSEAVPVINPETMAGLVKVFENRVNASGTTEAVVQQVGKDRVLVEVPGANPQAVKRRLLATAFLEFAQMNDKGEWVSTGITGADFKKAQAMSDGGMGWAVNFDLKPDSASKFSELTAK
jgi:preprotein translocase subunit SecD